MKKKYPSIPVFLILLSSLAHCSDISNQAFGSNRYGKPAAFGDFNSDELTDLFVIRNQKTVEILLGNSKEPFFNSDRSLNCTYENVNIINVVPGDFDGDALMDVLVVGFEANQPNKTINSAFIAWGNTTSLICSNKPLFYLQDEPLAIQYATKMKVDLFGVNVHGSRVLWLFDGNRTSPPEEKGLISPNESLAKLRTPNSHAFLDFNDDNWPDLYVTTEEGFEIWLWNQTLFQFHRQQDWPVKNSAYHIGQTLFMDLETADRMNHILPVLSSDRTNSSIYVYLNEKWYNLNVNFVQSPSKIWGFPMPDGHFPSTITLRAGDFNNDGYVDMLATLALVDKPSVNRVFLFENVPCTTNCRILSRTFEIQWDALSPFNENTIMGTFYDFLQDGILDIIFLQQKTTGNEYRISAFKNGLDYDANFVKVMVITGLTNSKIELPPTLLGTKRGTFGSNLPGPKIRYKTTNQAGNPQTGLSVQLPQSSHYALYLPYTIFGLGRTPNFIEDLTIGVFNKSRTWNQIIPNSQLVVIPYPADQPNSWKAQLFVTPSKIVLQTVVALAGTCVVIGFIIAILHWKERREDRIERLQEAHRFHFDAM